MRPRGLAWLWICMLLIACDAEDKGDLPAWRWTRVNATPPLPARYDASLATDPDSGLLYVFGGRSGRGALGDLWSLDMKTKSSHWNKVEGDTSPSPRSGAVLLALGQGRLLLHGGYRADAWGNPLYLQDLWFYAPEKGWQREYLSKGPGPRAWHGARARFGPQGQASQVLFFGGYGAAPAYHLQEVWLLDLKRMAWGRPATDGGPMGHGRPLLWQDEAQKELRAFQLEGVPAPEGAEIWSWTAENDTWSQIGPVAESPPLDFQVAADDPRSPRWLVLQGPDPDGRREHWHIWSREADKGGPWSRARAVAGPKQPVGMGCAPNPVAEGEWLCVGGAQRERVSGELWRLSPPAGGGHE